jgi:hypothetical protein
MNTHVRLGRLVHCGEGFGLGGLRLFVFFFSGSVFGFSSSIESVCAISARIAATDIAAADAMVLKEWRIC